MPSTPFSTHWIFTKTIMKKEIFVKKKKKDFPSLSLIFPRTAQNFSERDNVIYFSNAPTLLQACPTIVTCWSYKCPKIGTPTIVKSVGKP